MSDAAITEAALSGHETVVSPPGVFRSAAHMWRTRIGLALVVFIVGIAIVGPWVAPYGPTEAVGSGPAIRS